MSVQGDRVASVRSGIWVARVHGGVDGGGGGSLDWCL
jgi:hypothetical protein